MAADSGGKDRDLTKRIKSDPYFSFATRECYASFKNIINTLVFGQREKQYVFSYQDCYLLGKAPLLVLVGPGPKFVDHMVFLRLWTGSNMALNLKTKVVPILLQTHHPKSRVQNISHAF